MDHVNQPRAGEKRRRVYCEHCKNYLSKSTYNRHRMRYFDALNNQWVTTSSTEDYTVSTSSDSEGSIVWEDTVCDVHEPMLTSPEQVNETDLERSNCESTHYLENERAIPDCMSCYLCS